MSWYDINSRIRDCEKQVNKIECLKSLLIKTQNDGMVAHTLGKHLELQKRLQEALEYYQMAEIKFPKKGYKEMALESIARVSQELSLRETSNISSNSSVHKQDDQVPQGKIDIRSISSVFPGDKEKARWHFEDIRAKIRRFIAEIVLEDNPIICESENYIKMKETYKKSNTNLLVFLEVTSQNKIIISKITFDGGTMKDADRILLISDSMYEEAVLLSNGSIEILKCLACGATLEGSPDNEGYITCGYCNTRQRFLRRKNH